MGITKLKLLTNNPRKIAGLGGYGIEVVDRVPLIICPGDHNADYLNVKKTKLGHLLDKEIEEETKIDPFIAIFLDGKYKSIDLVPIKNLLNDFCKTNNIKVKPESNTRLLALWSRPKLVWRILHNRNRDDSSINNQEMKKIEAFIKILSEHPNSTKVGLIVSKNIEQAIHPTNNIKIETTKFRNNNELLYLLTRRFNLDKIPFSIIFKK